MKFILKRGGQFKCHWSNYDGRCGTDKNPIQTYNFLCQIETNDHLDKNGFIVDQLDVNETFQKLFYPDAHPAKSCELIALTAVHKIYDLILNTSAKGIKIYRIAVSISVPTPPGVIGEAAITAVWEITKKRNENNWA